MYNSIEPWDIAVSNDSAVVVGAVLLDCYSGQLGEGCRSIRTIIAIIA